MLYARVPELPSDLSRLGDEIVAAAERAVRNRRRRFALLERAAVAAAAALILVGGVAWPLAPVEHAGEPLQLASMLSTAVDADHWPACDHPRSATFTSPRPCQRPRDARSLPVLRPDDDLRLIQRRL